jgi:Transposase DDE domain
MDAFEQELIRRSPLAACVLGIFDFVFGDQLLASIWDAQRGRCYEDVLKFEDFLRLMRDALIHHEGSAHKLFLQLESRDAHPVDESNFYRKLANTPVELSRALLSQCTQRLGELLPQALVKLPRCFDGFEVIAGDGKAIKKAAKRLAPTRGFVGRLLGAKALVGINLRNGMAIAMSDSLDGMSNDVPLVPLLMPQLYEVVGQRPILSVWDRQFDHLSTLAHLSQRQQDRFVVRLSRCQTPFVVESSVKTRDAQGRGVLDEVGVFGRDKKAIRVRRITLFRQESEGEEDVTLLSNLLDRRQYAASDLLELYRHRWDIEQVFQQVTETFGLSRLIGSAPQAVLLQFAFCLLLYNLMQVIKAYVAEDGQVLASMVSMYYLFDDVRTELTAWAYHTDGQWPRTRRTAGQLIRHVRSLLKGSWDPIRYRKQPDKKPRPKPGPKRWLRGGHSSVQRVLEGRAKAVLR